MASGSEPTPTVRLRLEGEHGGISASTINKSLDALHKGLLALAAIEKQHNESPEFRYTDLGLGSLGATYAPEHPNSEAERDAILNLVPGLSYTNTHRTLHPRWNYDALRSIQRLIVLWNEGGAEGLTLTGPSGNVTVDEKLVEAVEAALSGEHKSFGAVIGLVHEWKHLIREQAERLTVRDEESNEDVRVVLHDGVEDDVGRLLMQRVLIRGVLSRTVEGEKRSLVARTVELLPQVREKRSIMEHAGVMGPLPSGVDVVEWQRQVREA